MPESERTALYRFYDGNGRTLYIGIARDPDVREELHRYWSSWHAKAVRRTVEWISSRQEALKIEKAAIRSERPLHNSAHNFELTIPTHLNWPSLEPVKRGKAAALADLIRVEIDSERWLPGQCIPSPEALADATSVSPTTAMAARRLLVRQNILRVVRGSGHFVAVP